MGLDREDIEKLENHENRLAALEDAMKGSRTWWMWLAVLAVQAIQTAIMYAALKH